MTYQVAIDPGEHTGIALSQGVTIIGAWALKHEHALPYVASLLDTYGPYGVRLVGEKPVVYPIPQTKVDPNDLITLAIKLGGYVGLATVRGVASSLVEPADWKRQLPKEVCAGRIKRALAPHEIDAVRNLAVLSKTMRHNAIDAIGIGLHHLGRSIIR